MTLAKRLQRNVTTGSAGTSQLNVDNRNRITGAPANCTAANAYCYDAAGDLLNDNFHQYTYDAESRIRQVDGGATTYTYDADGQRVRKDSPSGSTDYVYFGGSIIAEKTVSNGNWTDYLFAGGKRIVKADSFKDEIAVAGNNTAAGQYTWWGITGTPNVAVRTGDKLFFYHLQQGSAQGGMILTFSDGTNTGWAAQDQDGSYANVGTVVGQWHARIVDLSAYAGKTINQFLVGNSSAAPVGTWNAWYSDIAILSADGTVTPVYTGQASANFQFVSTSSPMASSLSASVLHDCTVGTNAQLTTNYYHGDQIGSSRLMTAGTGWPVWQGTFLPFGEEYSPQISSNHYKFNGHERDNETGLDYYGARYYGNVLGRFITPDWAAHPISVPYANFGNPQSLNLYAYTKNNPTTFGDPDGHCDVCIAFIGWVSQGVSALGAKQFTKDVAIGTAKGAGNFAVDTVKSAAAMGMRGTGNFGGAVLVNLIPSPKSVQPSNALQADVSKSTQKVLAIASVATGVAAPAATAARTVGAAQSALDAAIASRVSNPAVMVGAYDTTTGATAVGASGPLSRLGPINPDLAAAADQVGGVGAVNPGAPSPVGCCAEFDATNQLMNGGSSLDNIRFTDAVRPRTGEVVPKCPNCEKMFPDK